MDFISIIVGVLIGVGLCVAAFLLLPADGKLIVRKGEDGNNQYMFQIDDVDKTVTKPRIILAVKAFNSENKTN